MKTPEIALTEWVDDAIKFDAFHICNLTRDPHTREQMTKLCKKLLREGKLKEPILEQAEVKLGKARTAEFFVPQNIMLYESSYEAAKAYAELAGLVYPSWLMNPDTPGDPDWKPRA